MHGHVGGTFIEKLATLNWPKAVSQPVRVRVAALLAQMNSPIEKVTDGRAGLLSAGDVSKLCAKQNFDDVICAEAMMDDAREICDEVKVDQRARLQLCCEHDMRLINFIMKKGKASREGVEYSSLVSASQVFIDGVARVKGYSELNNPWLAPTRANGKQPRKVHGDDDDDDDDDDDGDDDSGPRKPRALDPRGSKLPPP